MQARAISTSKIVGLSTAKLLVIGVALSAATLLGFRTATSPLGAQGRLPVTIGNQAAGSFDDATGHSAQSHLVYAANSRVWWLFTLTSAADSQGGSNHIIKSFRSSGPDLTTATWVAAADSPPAVAATPNGFMGGGRALAVAYLDNTPVDVIHADISMAFDGQDGRTGHIRAVVTGTSITWSAWNYFDEPAATWTLPHGNTIGVSTGKFIHTGGPILQQEVDANVRKSTNADVGATWTSGFSVPVVIDGSMVNQDNALAFAPLANNVMLAVYDNGQSIEPNQTNLRYKRSNADGTWTGIVVGSQTGGDGNVFATDATINQNDWALVPVSTSEIYVFRRKANGSGVDAASYNVATNAWAVMSPAPPAFGAGQSFKAGAGLFGATDGSSVWLCVINTDLANSILCSRFDRTAWTPWSIVPGTDIGSQNRNYISGSPQVGNNQIGLIWTEGASLFDIVATSFPAAPDITPPAVLLTAPPNGAIISGTLQISATAADNVGVAGVQFRLDGVDFGPEITVPPYSIQWNTAASANGAHVLTAIARDQAGNTATSTPVSVIVANIQTPIITWALPQKIVVGTPLGETQLNARANTPGTFVYSPPPGTVLPAGLGQTLSARFTPTDAAGFTTATASVTIDVVNVVPSVAGLTQSAATASIIAAGLTVGTVTQASSATIPSGSVISQSPPGGTEVAANSAVNLVVSSGPPLVVVPNVVGLTQAAATTAIINAGLVVGIVTTAPSATVPAGSVISHAPAAGAQVTSGSAIALVISSGQPLVTVPDVVGLTQAAAISAIASAGLKAGVVTTAPSTTVPSGSVISQSPTAGTQAASGTTVVLVVSSGPLKVAVPNVAGLTQAAAMTAITSAGLVVGAVTTASSATVAAGTVISQNPAAATQVASGTEVALVVSSGPPPVAVPNVVGLTQAAATAALTSAGLVVGAVTTASSATVAAGAVISQNPAAASQVAIGSAVSILVSSGPPQVAVPNVVGLTQGAATTAITNAGLIVGTVTTTASATVPAGSVVSQDPTAGTAVIVASLVNLTVSSGPIAGPAAGTGAIGINFVGTATPMDATETAGVVAKANWNNATGAVSSTPLPLVDESGAATSAAVTWSASNGWMTLLVDQPGDARLMKGYLDTTNTSTTTVTVAGLAQRSYDVYVYVDGDNRTYERSAAYTISGAGITATTINLTDAANATFAGTFTRADNSAGNYVKFSITAAGFTLSATPNATVVGNRRAPINGIQIVPVAPAPPPAAIGIRFVGTSTVTMAADESAGVVPQAHWNNATGAARTTPLALVDDSGAATTATVTWTANNGWMTPILDQPGNARLMKGYLDTSSTSSTTVTVAGLLSGAYDVYVYVDGDNRQYVKTATYRITGNTITTTTASVTDPANTNFSGGFSEATAAASLGNYVKFSINGDGFTLTATPGTSTNASLRAPVNAIQIVRAPR